MCPKKWEYGTRSPKSEGTNTTMPILAAWLIGNALVLINVVALRRARLVLGWVTVRGYTILVFNQSGKATQVYST